MKLHTKLHKATSSAKVTGSIEGRTGGGFQETMTGVGGSGLQEAMPRGQESCSTPGGNSGSGLMKGPSSSTDASRMDWVCAGGYSDQVSDKGSSDSGGSGGGQSSGSGKQQKSGSESSNSSSQQSGSGSRSGGGGGGKAGGGSCSRSGSSDSSGDDDDEDDGKRRRPHRGGGGPSKDLKPKLLDEDDEATDSADEGVDDATPNSMIMDFSSPRSNQSGSGADHTSTTTTKPPLPFASNISTYSHTSSSSQPSGSQRPSTLTPNHFEGGKADSVMSAAPPGNQGGTGTVAIESMESSNMVEPSNAINMIVGYGVPASAPPQPVGKSPPESELGTPTLDSPSSLVEEKATPLAATPVPPVTPVLSPALTLLPQVKDI